MWESSGVAALFHYEAAPWSSLSTLWGGEGEGAVPASMGSSRRPAHAEGLELGSLVWRLRPPPRAGTRTHAIGPVATCGVPKLQDSRGRVRPTPRCGGVALLLCLYFCSKAQGMKTSPTRSGGTSGDAAGMSPTALWPAWAVLRVMSREERTHLSGDSDTVVMAG